MRRLTLIALGAAGLGAPEEVDPFFEPSMFEFFEKEIPVLTDITTEQFERYMRRGQPVKVTDAGRGWKMLNWTCESMSQEFGGKSKDGRDAKMFMSYANLDGSGQTPTEIGDTEWMEKQHHTDRTADPEDSGPKFAPFYWGIKDGEDDPSGLKAKIQKHTQLPYFMRDVPSNSGLVNNSCEFWFNRPGAGAKAHVDSHCQSTMTVQLSGSRKWYIGPPPPVSVLSTAPAIYDGHLSRHWKPLYEVPMNPGDGLFIPSGTVHQTHNTGGTCSASVTFQVTDSLARQTRSLTPTDSLAG
jgi:mannose-6-phosphate isomerase-like protein (cupin superfamily)